jgi:hypothetical protein
VCVFFIFRLSKIHISSRRLLPFPSVVLPLF